MGAYLNPLHVVLTSQRFRLKLTRGEFVLESGIRVCGDIEGGQTSPGIAIPCDLHEVVFRVDSLGVARARLGNPVTIEVVASMSDKFPEIEGTLENGAGGTVELAFGDGRLVLREPGTSPFKLKRV